MIFIFASLVVGVIFLWMIVAWSKIGYLTYWWQLKQYRQDRMVSHLREPEGSRLFANRTLFYKAGIAFIALIAAALGNLGLWFYYLVYLLYAIETVLLIRRALYKNVAFPVLTAKSLLIMVASFVVPLAVLFYLLVLPTITQFLLLLLLVDIALPVIVTFWVLVLQPFSWVAKQYIIRKALQKRASLSGMRAIGIAGSVGKTSTKEFLAHILSATMKVLKTKEHQNTEIGAARALLQTRISKPHAFVAEMGAYRPGDIQEIAQVVQPTIGIITSLGYEHLSLFGNLEASLETEFELAYLLPKTGHLVVNADNEFIRKLLEGADIRASVMRYSIKDATADVYADHIKEDLEQLSFDVHYKKKKAHMVANVLGTHNVSNLLAAISAALLLKMKLEDIAGAVTTLMPLPHTMQVHHGIKKLIIIDDSYNASPESVQSALAHIKRYKGNMKVVVMPSLIELGDKAALLHEDIGSHLASVADWAIITDTHYKEAIEQGWKTNAGKADQLVFMQDAAQIAQFLKEILQEESVLLIEGRVPAAVSSLLVHHFYSQQSE